MCDFVDSSQLKDWLFTPELLEKCRKTTNRKARKFLATSGKGDSDAGANGDKNEKETKPSSTQQQTDILPIKSYAAGYPVRQLSGVKGKDDEDSSTEDDDDYWTRASNGHSLLNHEEEQLLIQFYAGKIGFMIGPKAEVSRLRRDVKVPATAALLFRRFYLSNSVMMYDPKAMMVAASFLASKVEDATASVRDLEEGTKRLQAHVSADDIIHAELRMLDGIDSDLMCFHPYKTVLAYTEDLRTYLKSKAGAAAVRWKRRDPQASDENDAKAPRPVISGEILRPIHDAAWKIVDDACVSDIPLLYTPGQIGLAAMILANEELERQRDEEALKEASKDVSGEEGKGSDEKDTTNAQNQNVPYIDLNIYVKNRFKGRSEKEHKLLEEQMDTLKGELRELRKSGKHGCGNFDLDMGKLKGVHKKLKKCKAWGAQEPPAKEKKEKKRKAEESGSTTHEDEPATKKSAPNE